MLRSASFYRICWVRLDILVSLDSLMTKVEGCRNSHSAETEAPKRFEG